MAGDSTMADKPLDLPERGWGMALPEFFRDPAMVKNHAMNGRSTKSFITEGRWQKITDELRPGDWVIIQFGHNDEKQDKPAVYAEAATDYRENLRRFVRETRAKPANPVLATPVARRKFSADGKLMDTPGAYPEAVRAVAKEEGVPLLELERATSRLLAELGDARSKDLFMWIAPGKYPKLPEGKQDDTHFVEEGARRVAAIATDQMRKQKLGLVEWLN